MDTRAPYVILGNTLFALVLLATAPLEGEPPPQRTSGDPTWAKLSGEAPDIRFETLSRADGIPPYRAHQVLQDRRGFTW